MPPRIEPAEAARRRGQEYESTVQALLAFAALVVHDGTGIREYANFGFGRRMHTSESNPISPSADVTPDLVAQKSLSYGIIGEIKRTLSRQANQWESHLRQLRKYDDDLEGWWTATEHIEEKNVVSLLHQTRSVRFARYLDTESAKDPTSVGPTTTVVEFNLSNELNAFMFFRLLRGRLRDDELASILDEGRSVPLAKLLSTFPSIRFCDARPPLHWFLSFLWLHVFAPLIDPKGYDEQIRAYPLRVSVIQITRELQRAFGSCQLSKNDRAVEFPKQSWVRDALTALVRVRLARQVTEDDYMVLFRRFRDDVLERFAHLVTEEEPPAQEQSGGLIQTQLPLEHGPNHTE